MQALCEFLWNSGVEKRFKTNLEKNFRNESLELSKSLNNIKNTFLAKDNLKIGLVSSKNLFESSKNQILKEDLLSLAVIRKENL